MMAAKTFLDATEHDRMDAKVPSPFHYLKSQRRRETRTIREVQDSQGNITQPQEVIDPFVTHLWQRYEPIPVNSLSCDGSRTTYSLPIRQYSPHY